MKIDHDALQVTVTIRLAEPALKVAIHPDGIITLTPLAGARRCPIQCRLTDLYKALCVEHITGVPQRLTPVCLPK